MQIGFIGLGEIGGPMAHNLAAAGHQVRGFDPEEEVPEGVTPADSAAEAAIGAGAVFLSQPDGDTVRDVATRILDGMAAGAVLVDCSTIGVAASREVAVLAARHAIEFLDAPVTGGVGAAKSGTLTIMAGGPTDTFARMKPLFDVVGNHAHHCGEAGTGQAAKLCNNLLTAITMIGTCEAFAMADRLGLGRKELFDVVSNASGASWSLTSYCPAPGIGPTSPADQDYAPGYPAERLLQDLALARAAAEESGAETPLGHAAAELYRTFVEDEDGRGRDFSAMLPRFAAQRAD